MKPLIKYPGGKEQELKQIIPNLPENIANYYEPFVGGGSVFFALEYNHYYINDISEELTNLYEFVKEQNEDFFNFLIDIDNGWKNVSTFVNRNRETLIDVYVRNEEIDAFLNRRAVALNNFLPNSLANHREGIRTEVSKNIKSKFRSIRRLQTKLGRLNEEDLFENIKCGFKFGLYTHLRNIYNSQQRPELKTALYVFFREYCYSSMFRYNKDGHFNVPYGGMSYNEKYMTNKIELMRSNECIEKFDNTTISCNDFYDFMNQYQPEENDFIFLDPPYDSDFSTYANNEFNRNDQARLRDYLVNECNAKWMMVIKNTDYIYNLYDNHNLNIIAFDKKYLVSFKNRNNKDCEHLLIKNY